MIIFAIATKSRPYKKLFYYIRFLFYRKKIKHLSWRNIHFFNNLQALKTKIQYFKAGLYDAIKQMLEKMQHVCVFIYYTFKF